jgi:hypothetical protein
MRIRSLRLVGPLALFLPVAAWAGPPFLTDDPEPTGTGHWEIYGPIIEATGKGSAFAGSTGIEVNFGPVPGVQLTVELPVAYVHDAAGTSWGAGDVAVSVKYRFYHDEATGLSVAAFPGLTLPTGSNGMGSGRVTALLPLWIQKDAGPWTVFGGGGYAINPGDGNRDYWTGGIAVARHLGKKLLIGVEADRQGPDVDDGTASTSLGIGAIYQLKAPFRVLASAGPTFDDQGGSASFHAFLALGLDF